MRVVNGPKYDATALITREISFGSGKDNNQISVLPRSIATHCMKQGIQFLCLGGLLATLINHKSSLCLNSDNAYFLFVSLPIGLSLSQGEFMLETDGMYCGNKHYAGFQSVVQCNFCQRFFPAAVEQVQSLMLTANEMSA